MSKWMSAVALLAVLFVVVSCATPEPTVAPTEVPAPTVEAQVAPTDVPRVEIGGTGMTAEEIEAAAVELGPEVLALWNIEYTLPDGTVVTPGMPPVDEDAIRIAVVSDLIAKGDVNEDGTQDQAVVLANTTNPEQVELYVAVLVDQNGQLVNSGTVALEPGLGSAAITIENGNVVMLAPATDAEWQYLVWAWSNGMLDPVGQPTPMPAPTAVPTDTTSQVPPPTVGITIYPPSGYSVAGTKVDVYVHAYESAGIVALDLYIDNVKQESEWRSSDPNGVPYTHQTLPWRKSVSGTHHIFVTATDKFGQVGTSKIEKYIVP